jgi:hypothetical protein
MARPTGIPRLQELAFLSDAVLAVAEGQTFDQVRLTMFDNMERRRAGQALTGHHAGTRRRGADEDEFGYLHNASEALAELMRLGYLEQQALPSSRKTLELHRRRTFELTESGTRWMELLRSREIAMAYDELFTRLWVQHPQLAQFFRKLQEGLFIIPTAQWGEAQSAGSGTSLQER